MTAKYVRRFFGDLPKLLAEGVLDESSAQRLREYYESHEPGRSKNGLLICFGILGALLIGLGCMLLFGHNWEDLSRPMRTVLSLAPLAIMLGIAGYGLWLGHTSVAWRESVGTLWMLSVGAAIALISQTYHIQGDILSFIVSWMFLSIPIVYLLNATAPAIGYLIGISAWGIGMSWSWEDPLRLWGLLVMILPYIIWRIVAAPNGFQSKVLQLGSALALSLTLGCVLTKQLPGLVIIVYAGFFTCLYLYASLFFDASASPFRGFGKVGSLVLMAMLSVPGAREAFWDYTADSRFAPWAIGLDYALATALLLTTLFLLVLTLRRRQFHMLPLGVLSVFVILDCLGTISGIPSPWMAMLFTLYLLATGLFLMVYGFRNAHIGDAILGFCAVAALITIRFFSDEYSMVARGLVFIALGVAFLIMNVLFLKRRKEVAV